jgi:hypothetical protein
VKAKEVIPVLWATAALANGTVTLSHNNDAVRADGQATAYEQVGYYAEADQARAEASDARDNRNIYLGLTALNLSLVGMTGASVVAARNRRREQ